MNGIGDYLKRYVGIHSALEQKKNIFSGVVFDVLHVDISKKTIQFKDTTVSISGLNSSERTLLFLKKKNLIEGCLKKGLVIIEIR
jgi:hypothetical protein